MFEVNHINLDYPTYHKSYAINLGVRACKHDLIVILDSDRVLPANYFTDLAASFKPKTAVTPLHIRELFLSVTDAQIEKGEYNYTTETRSVNAEPERRNLFSGNTMILKEDFVGSGGFDEKYVGYGFHDNDMTMTVMAYGVKPVFLDVIELHLYHPKEIIWNGQKMASYGSVVCAVNALYYLNKWKLPKTDRVYTLLAEAWRRVHDAPEELRNAFLKAQNVNVS